MNYDEEHHPTIKGVQVLPGYNDLINFNIAKLPSGTPIDLPVYVYRSKNPGPVLMLSGGLHGDEINGVAIIRRMIADQSFENLKCGSVIAIPIINIYGFLSFSREVPDGKDINRNFPGSKTGSLAALVAHFMTHHILPEINCGIDFHTGGGVRYNYPQVRYAKRQKGAGSLAKAFEAPLVLESALIDKSLRKQASKFNAPVIVYEGGESMRLDNFIINEAIEGTQRVMKSLNMINDAPKQALKTVYCAKSTWIRSRSSGILNLKVSSGSFVKRNDIMGFITDPFNTFKIAVKAPRDGFVLGHNNMPVINRGDALFHLGYND